MMPSQSPNKLTPNESQHKKFADLYVTATGEERAQVPLIHLHTLWINTGTLCNIECSNCYIHSSPKNDRLLYMSREKANPYYDEIAELTLPVEEIGFTGGEPFMNPEIIGLLDDALARNFRVLVLTNAMQPMMRRRVQSGLLQLHKKYGGQLKLRVSLDHYTQAQHDQLRGQGSFEKTLCGMRWLAKNGLSMDVAGRTIWGENESESRAGFKNLFAQENFAIDADNPATCILFPEMDEQAEVPEITTACWGILDKKPQDVMCANSRMVVWHKGQKQASVIACTLVPYDKNFNLGHTLAEASRPVYLAHPHCAKFCVLGGASCSVS